MNVHENNIGELISEVRMGGQTAFTKIIGIYDPMVNSLVAKYAREGSGYDRQDIRQEAVIALYNAVRTYDSEKYDVSFGLYAKICIKNRIITFLRKQKKYNKKTNQTPIPQVDPEQRAISRENFAHLMNIIENNLTSIEKSVFYLYILDYPYRRIAYSLGISEKSVDNAVYRIKAKVKKLI